jgi:carbonic anhydrase/acetyltransferase-like protein (isoleucine patch superfamily)
MLIEHRGKRPNIDPAAVVAPTAVICGDVTIGPRTHLSFGPVLVACGGCTLSRSSIGYFQSVAHAMRPISLAADRRWACAPRTV